MMLERGKRRRVRTQGLSIKWLQPLQEDSTADRLSPVQDGFNQL